VENVFYDEIITFSGMWYSLFLSEVLVANSVNRFRLFILQNLRLRIMTFLWENRRIWEELWEQGIEVPYSVHIFN